MAARAAVSRAAAASASRAPAARSPSSPGTELGAGDDGARRRHLARRATNRVRRDAATADVADVAAAPRRRPRRAHSPAPTARGLPRGVPTAGALAFVAGGRLKELTLETGAVRDVAAAAAPGGVAWLDDGSLRVRPPRWPGRSRWCGTGATIGGHDAAARRSCARVAGACARAGSSTSRPARRRAAGDAIRAPAARRTTSARPTVTRCVAGVDPAARPRRRAAGAAPRRQRGALHGRATALATAWAPRTGGRSSRPRLDCCSFRRGHARARAGVAGTRTARAVRPASDRGDYWQVRVAPDDRAAAVTPARAAAAHARRLSPCRCGPAR